MRTLLDRLNSRLPIWSAGMGGGLSGAELVAAVNDAGGFGVLGAGAMPAAGIKQLVEQTRQLTSRPFGANVIMPMSDGSDIEACFDAAVDVLVLFWGDPQPFVNDAHKRGMFVVSQCGGPEDAVAAADAGVDAVILQGVEGGGHVKATTALAENLAATAAVLGSVPIIAAGGIATGAGIAAALNHCAHAVSLGTRFVASREAQAVDAYKQLLTTATATDTVMTQLFDIGWPDANHRVLRNSTYDTWEAAGKPASGQRPGEGEEIGVYAMPDGDFSIPRYGVFPASAAFVGDVNATALYAGQSVDDVNSIESVADIMARLEDELRRATA